jgi:prevent-host-death family protein
MRTVTALDVRKRFGEIVDEAARGERIVIERAGQPIAALVPLSDLAALDPERRRAARLAALDDLRRLARQGAARKRPLDAEALVRASRQRRTSRVAGRST